MREQDLSAYPTFSRGERNGLRYFSAWLPVPSWTKHTRTAITAEPGFRPLVKAARLYREFLGQAVLCAGFEALPWLREKSEWALEFISFTPKHDHDQWSEGLQDDLVKVGLLSNDRWSESTLSRRVRTEKGTEPRLFLAGYETERQAENGASKSSCS